MASYKVPQDVEAEDKLIGPFGFRQFVYLIIAALAGVLGFFLARIFIGLIVIPLPIFAFFVILALPLRKDQPMEMYLLAVVRFFFKPHRRMWLPEGNAHLVDVVAPVSVEEQLTKNFSGDEASQRLGYLAQVVDTQGWSTRGVTSATDNLSDTMVAEAQNAEDVLDENTSVSKDFSSMISKSDAGHKQALMQQFQQSRDQPVPQQPAQPVQTPLVATSTDDVQVPSSFSYNPYPASMHQHIVSPGGQQPQAQTSPVQPVATKHDETASSASAETVSPDIMRLANNNDLSISTLAREAHRLAEKGKDDGEVIISLR